MEFQALGITVERDDAEQGPASPEAGGKPKDGPRPDRTWAERFVPPVKFRRFTGTGFDNKPQIFIQFFLPPEQERLDPGVYEILQELKRINRGPEHGMGQDRTGLKAVSNARQKPGTLWVLPDTPIGRTAADIVVAKLLDLAHEIERQQGKSR